MRNRTILMKSLRFAGVWLCFAGATMAQDSQPPQGEEKPKPAGKAYGPIGSENDDANQSPDLLQPDERPLTGFQQTTVGTPFEKHSYWVPGVSYFNFLQSNGRSQGGSSSWNSTSYLTGNLSLLENWSHSQLALNYSGGGDFSTDSAMGNGWFHQLGAVDTVNLQRWQFTFLEQFAYLPQSQFGFGVGTGLSLPGIGGSLGPGSTGLGGGLSPGQSLFTAIGPRYTNSFGVQANYVLSPRSSITVGALFGIMRFTLAGNIESNDYIFNAGYNYQLTHADTIGIVYRFSSFHYIGFPEAIGDHTVQLAYGRKITGRLALQLSGGLEITHLRGPKSVGTNSQQSGGTGNAALSYAFANGGISANYFHIVTPGNGVFLGAITDQVTGSGTRKLTRVWTGSANVGFARNRGLNASLGTSNLNYNTIYAGASVARPLGRNANFSLGYTGYIETSNGTVCAGNNCASNFTTNQVTVGLSWHTRPYTLR